MEKKYFLICFQFLLNTLRKKKKEEEEEVEEDCFFSQEVDIYVFFFFQIIQITDQLNLLIPCEQATQPFMLLVASSYFTLNI